MSDSAAKHRARQTIVNLVLALAASVAVVVMMVLAVPRDESNRVKEVNYSAIVDQAKSSSGLGLIKITPLEGWWCNLAQLNTSSSDAVSNFKAGFVGSSVKYIGYTQAFSTNPTWLAFQLKQKTIVSEYRYLGKTWQIYQSVVKHEPAQTMDYMMVLQYNSSDYILLYGVADQSEFEAFANQITERIMGRTNID